MEIETSKITSKGQTTIPISIRKALSLSSGDEILFENKDNHISLRKVEILDVEYLKATQSCLSREWDSKEDSEAYDDL